MSLPKWLVFPWADWLADPLVLVGLGAGTIVLAMATFLILPFYLARVPVDYFEAPRRHRIPGRIWWFARLAKNIVGLCLLGPGIAMLVLPGQGLLTILAALWLIDFPGKYRLERRIISLPGVLNSINRLRARSGQPPLTVGIGPTKPHLL